MKAFIICNKKAITQKFELENWNNKKRVESEVVVFWYLHSSLLLFLALASGSDPAGPVF